MGAEHLTTDMQRDSLEQYLDLYSAHQRRLYLYINAMLPNPADADEVFQETNIIIWQKFNQFEAGMDFLAWAYRLSSKARSRFALAGKSFSSLARRVRP